MLTNTFGPTGTFPKHGPDFGFLFSSGGMNPMKTCGSMQFTVKTYATLDGVDYAVDEYSFDSIVDVPPRFWTFSPMPIKLTASILNLTSYIASFKPVNYTFSVTPSLVVPAGSFLAIQMPPGILLPFGVYQVLCKATTPDGFFYEYAIPTKLDPLRF